MHRLLLNLLTALSLLLCVTAGALWVRSYTRIEGIGFRNSKGDLVVVDTTPGNIEWTVRTPGPGPARLGPYSGPRPPGVLLQLSPRRRFLGFGSDAFDFDLSVSGAPAPETWRGVTTPLWAWVLLFGILPARAALTRGRRWHRARTQAGLCAQCGYDLRATPERCPECGHAASVTQCG